MGRSRPKARHFGDAQVHIDEFYARTRILQNCFENVCGLVGEGDGDDRGDRAKPCFAASNEHANEKCDQADSNPEPLVPFREEDENRRDLVGPIVYRVKDPRIDRHERIVRVSNMMDVEDRDYVMNSPPYGAAFPLERSVLDPHGDKSPSAKARTSLRVPKKLPKAALTDTSGLSADRSPPTANCQVRTAN